MRIPLDQVLNGMAQDQFLVGGKISDVVRKEAECRGLVISDYLLREELAVMNAVPTAEGAIQLAMEELPVTIDGAKCLITGYGRVGRTLSKRLVSLGAQVTVAARKFADLAWAKSTGCETLELENLADAGDFDVIFNTVPVMLFGRDILKGMEKETLLIDLASRPGGVDFNAAAEMQIKTIWALSLPGRVAPKTAGAIIKKTILNMIKEGS